MKTNHSVWWSIIGNMCLCLITVRKLRMFKLIKWAQLKLEFLVHRGESSYYSQYWPWDTLAAVTRHSETLLSHVSNMEHQTAVLRLKWGGTQFRSGWNVEHGDPAGWDSVWQTEWPVPDTPHGNSANWRQQALLHYPLCFLGFPACHDATVVASTTCELRRETAKCTESLSYKSSYDTISNIV